MAVEIKDSESGSEVKVALLSGRLDMAAVEADSPIMLRALDESPAGIVVDLGAVDFISSSGLRMLLEAYKRSSAADKKIALIHAQPAVYKIFKVASLDKMFHFFEDETEAIETLRQ